MRTTPLLVIALTASTSITRVPPALAAPPTDEGVVRGTSACDHPAALRFKPGAHATTVQAVVTRDEIGCYAFSARADQIFDLAMTGDSTENASAVVFKPGWGNRTNEGLRYTDGPTLPGAGRGDAARHIHVRLPTTGRYLILTGPAYGDAAAYTMQIEIH